VLLWQEGTSGQPMGKCSLLDLLAMRS